MPKIDVGKNKVGARFSRWRENDRKRQKKFLILFFPSGLPWIPNTSSSVYYRKTKREGEVKIIIILQIYFFVKAYLDLFFPTQQSTTLLTTHTLEEGQTRFLLVCNERETPVVQQRAKAKRERREGPAFLLFRKAILVRSPLPPPVWLQSYSAGKRTREKRRKNPQGRLPFLL